MNVINYDGADLQLAKPRRAAIIPTAMLFRTHQQASRSPPSRRPAGDLGRYQEVDTKKKELIGAYKNAGSDYRPQGCPDEVNVHDFVDKELGKAIPYGVYDIAADGEHRSPG